MVGHTHRLAGFIFPMAFGIYTGHLAEMSLISLALSFPLGNLPDYDMNDKNTTTGDVIDSFKRQGIMEQSLRILFKKLSGGEHRGFTHSFLFLFIMSLILSPILLLDGFTIYDLIGMILAIFSHIFIDMFNGAGARVLYPIKHKLNFLNLIPNAMKAGMGDTVRVKGWDIPMAFRLIGFVIVLGGMSYIFRHYYVGTIGLEHYGALAGLGVMFYLFIKLMFVTTGSEAETILWQYPLSAIAIFLVATNIQPLFETYKNATLFLSNHAFLVIFLVIFLVMKGVNIFDRKIEKFFDTKQISGLLLSAVVVGSFFHPTNLINSVKDFSIEETKSQFTIENVKTTYGEAFKKLKEDSTSFAENFTTNKK